MGLKQKYTLEQEEKAVQKIMQDLRGKILEMKQKYSCKKWGVHRTDAEDDEDILQEVKKTLDRNSKGTKDRIFISQVSLTNGT